MKKLKAFFPIVIVSLLIGAILTIIVLYFLNSPKQLTEKRIPGGISLDQGEAYFKQNNHVIISSWRSKSRGVWYDPGRVDTYTKSINDLIISNPDFKPVDGYSWKIAIYFGGAPKSNGSEQRLNAMFVPVLVQNVSPNNVIDVFDAKYYYNHLDKTTPLPWDSKITYYDIYDKYYSKFNLLKTLANDIVFDDGNMFP